MSTAATTSSTPAHHPPAWRHPGLDAAAWARFEQQGYLLLGPTLDQPGLDALEQRIDDYMLGHTRDDGLMMQLDAGGDYGAMEPMTLGFKGPRLDYRKIENLERDERFRSYLQQDLFRAICRQVYGAGMRIAIFRAMVMNKPANKGTLLPWHQDGGGSWGLDRDPLVTIWTALDPATRANGCVQVIPGSHHQGLLSPAGHTISAEHAQAHCPPERIVHLELAAGESVLLHNWLLHRSDVNRTPIPRRAFSVCYMDARTRQRDSTTSFPDVFHT